MTAAHDWRDLAPHLEAIWPTAEHTLRRRTGPTLWARAEAYALLPRPSAPALLLPTAPASVAAAAMRRYGSAATASGRRRSTILGMAARTGLARLLPGTLVIEAGAGARSLITHLCDVLGGPLVASIHLGPPRANRKPVLTLMHPTGDVAGFAKVGVNHLTRERVVAETLALKQLAGVDLGTIVAPSVLAAGDWHDANYLVLSAVETRSGQDISPPVRDQAGRDLIAAFEVRTGALESLSWWRGLRERLEKCAEPEADDLRELATAVEQRAAGSEVLTGAQHGDWTPWNLQTIGATTSVWDWERFALGVPVGLDQLHYAFHRATALEGVAPAAALADLRLQASSLLEIHDYDAGQVAIAYLLYLMSTGERFLTDGQLAAGSRKGNLGRWLLPELRRAVGEFN